MDRKQRRALGKISPVKQAPSILEASKLQTLLQEAVRLHQLGKLAEAEGLYRRILMVSPRHADALHLLGLLAYQLGHNEAAIDLFQQAISISGQVAAYHLNHGNALRNLGRLGEALRAYDKAILLNQDYPLAYSNRGNTLIDLGRPEEALASFDEALRLRPDYAEAMSNRATALVDLGRPEEALSSAEKALGLGANFAEAHINRGNAFKLMNRVAEGAAACRSAVSLAPDDANAHFNLSQFLLVQGHYEEGWREYDWRWRRQVITQEHPRHTDKPYWRGEPPSVGKTTLLVWSEQGLGDTLQFIRYVPFLVRMGWDVVVEAQAPLIDLLASMEGVRCVAQNQALPEFHAQCPLLSLPFALKTTLETVPAEIPYLLADRQKRADWRKRLPQSGLRVGIIWQGNPDHKNDRNRSVPLSSFAPLANMPDVHLVSLQKNHGLEQLNHLPGISSTLGPDYDGGNFDDTAAIIEELDLVICVDTSVAHLAGALGCPVWLALPFAPDWRWMLDREDSPWYPTMRLFRQSAPGDWNGVFAKIASDLAKFKS